MDLSYNSAFDSVLPGFLRTGGSQTSHTFREKDFLEKSLCLGPDSHLYGVCVADHHSDQRKLRAVQDESSTAEWLSGLCSY